MKSTFTVISGITRTALSKSITWLCLAALALSSCIPVSSDSGPDANLPANPLQPALATGAAPQSTPTQFFPDRPRYAPGELVDYTAQTGDTLPGLAMRFNTTVKEILEANSFIPPDATTMPPGMPMKIPIYYLPLWGSPYQIIPDSLFVNGPAQVGFDTEAFVNSHPGWLKNYSTYVADANRTGAGIVDYVAHNYSVSPRLLLALLEYQAQALSSPILAAEDEDYPLGLVALEPQRVCSRS